jgi:single-strand DNA-binding protein
MDKYRLPLFANPIFVSSTTTSRLAEIKKFIILKLSIMYALRNKVQLIGNLGNAPDVRTTENGKKLAQFNVATNESYRNAKGEKVTETQWHRVIAWGRVAEIAEKYLDKGKEVALEGKLVNRSYTDKEGNKKYITEIQVSELLLLGAKSA